MALLKLEMQPIRDGLPIDVDGIQLWCIIDTDEIASACEVTYLDEDNRPRFPLVQILTKQDDRYLVKDSRRFVLPMLLEHLPETVKCEQ